MNKKADITALVAHKDDITLNTHHSFPHLSDLHSHHARHISSEEGCIGDYYSGKTPQVCMSSPLQSTVISEAKDFRSQWSRNIRGVMAFLWESENLLPYSQSYQREESQQYSLKIILFWLTWTYPTTWTYIYCFYKNSSVSAKWIGIWLVICNQGLH